MKKNSKCNAIKKKKYVILPYGLALMLLRGATADLEEAMKRENLNRVKLCSDRLSTACYDFMMSEKHDFDKTSIVCLTYQKIAEESKIAADVISKKSIEFLRSSFTIVN